MLSVRGIRHSGEGRLRKLEGEGEVREKGGGAMKGEGEVRETGGAMTEEGEVKEKRGGNVGRATRGVRRRGLERE